MKLVIKFGGSCLVSGEGVRRAAEIIVESLRTGNRVVAVVAALSGVTDELALMAKKAEEGHRKDAETILRRLEEKDRKALRDAVGDRGFEVIAEGIEEEFSRLGRDLNSIGATRTISTQDLDSLLSYGERLSSRILLGALQKFGVRAKRLANEEVGIITDSAFGKAKPKVEDTFREVRARIAPLIEDGICPVVTGFIATDATGATTTLGRGGSDYSATLIGAALGADEVWIWIDVDGIMTADPDIVQNARTLPILSYAEASELAHLRSPPLHPKTLEPAMGKSIPVRVKNIFNPTSVGTLIVQDPEKYEGVVKAVTLVRNTAILTVAGTGMIENPGTAAKVFECMGRNHVNIMMISQGCSESSISFLVKGDDLAVALASLNAEFRNKAVIEQIIAEQDVATVAAVGAGMRGTPGIASRVFGSVARKGINVLMIAQGSSELNISFVVSELDGEEAVRAIHEEFQLQNL